MHDQQPMENSRLNGDRLQAENSPSAESSRPAGENGAAAEMPKSPRRRRSERNAEAAGGPAEAAQQAAEAPGIATEERVTQAADSRIPAEARRMSASPYGAVRPAPVRRPGTRPAQAVRRPVQEIRRTVPEARRTERPAALPETDSGRTTRVSVGYAPGRMNLHPRTARDEARELQAPREYGRDAGNGRAYGREVYGQEEYEMKTRNPGKIRAYPGNRYGLLPEERKPQPAKRHPVMWMLTALLLVIGLALVVLLSLPEDHTVRRQAENAAKTIAEPVAELLNRKNREPDRIRTFNVTGNEKATAPTDVIFSVTTDSSVEDLRLTDEDGREVDADLTRVDNTDNKIWSMTLHAKDGYKGTVTLQTRQEGQDWTDTEYTAALAIEPPLAVLDASGEESPEGDASGEPAEMPEEAAGEGGSRENEPGEDPAGDPDDSWESIAGTLPEEQAEDMPVETAAPTPAPTDTPEPTPEPTPTPPLTAQADPGADPSLITTTVVYNGSKKQKDYMRPAKALIHMPDGDQYTAKKIGVLTFRGNAFRQNAAVGEVTSAAELAEIWQTEASSARGASQVFYGYEWTGQPAIVKWSTQVRAGSNIDEDLKTKSALREVIIAGVDGVIRFMDLEDGTTTRAPISLGYPMKGTPSVHPAGYPYMNVGQYTRKMKTKTGKIGLRQYNLYNQKELALIDGLDGTWHRGYNRIGSFETSALIDRTSDTVITLGTNGLLYLTRLDTDFDYQAGTLKINPSTIVMASKAKGQKKTERMAVESSHAMYDRYVFYADMGGVLRCVDTNFLTPVWAVETGDAVMAAVALDLREDRLDLYTANMLANRSKGNVQIRRYNAMSGKELWTVEIGVAKNTKTKEDVGVKASPVIGQNGLGDLVYFTVTGLNDEGRSMLNVPAETKAALLALEKETGRIRWTKGLSDRSESSPVAVYDAEGNGWIIQCAEDGTVLLLDGETGEKLSELKLDGNIKASPAVYNDILVIGTTGKGTEFVYGIRIK